jgi:hypothetical protein
MSARRRWAARSYAKDGIRCRLDLGRPRVKLAISSLLKRSGHDAPFRQQRVPGAKATRADSLIARDAPTRNDDWILFSGEAWAAFLNRDLQVVDFTARCDLLRHDIQPRTITKSQDAIRRWFETVFALDDIAHIRISGVSGNSATSR